MKNLKEVNGKNYIDAKVVMLATNNKSILSLSADNKLWQRSGYINSTIEIATIGHVYQHLYVTSNEEPKEGDWIIYNNSAIAKIVGFDESTFPVIIEFISKKRHDTVITTCKKIVATTDTSLWINVEAENHQELPQPSKEFIESFIESYNNGKAITDVLIEVVPYIKMIYLEGSPRYNLKFEDNTIIIKVKAGIVYTQKQLGDLLNDFLTIPDNNIKEHIKLWIKEKL